MNVRENVRHSQSRIRWLLVLFLFLFFGGTEITHAMEESETSVFTEKLLGELELREVQNMVDMILDKNRFSVTEAVRQIMAGGKLFSFETIRELLRTQLFSRFDQEKGRMERLLLLILFGAVFSNLSAAFGQGQAGETGFYVVYLLIFTMLMNSFSELSLSLSETMQMITQLLKALSPAYFLAVAASTGTGTAFLFYQGVLLLVWAVQWILLNFLLPAVNLYLLLCLINALSKEEMLGKMADLLKTLISWSLNTLLSVMLGLQVVRSLITPVIDHWKRSALGKTAGALPGIGNAINSVTELVLGSAVLVRNSLGIVFLIVLLLAGISPLIHYGFLSFSYRFLAAVSEPISDKRLVGCLSAMGEGCAMLLRIFLTTELMCLLSFVILMASMGGVGW